MPVVKGLNECNGTGVDIRYSIFGPEDENAPAVVCVAGFMSQQLHIPYNTLVMPLISQGYRVIRIENRDAGHSTTLDREGKPDLVQFAAKNQFNKAANKDLKANQFLHPNPQLSPAQILEEYTPLPEFQAKSGLFGHVDQTTATDSNSTIIPTLGPDYKVTRGFAPRKLAHQYDEAKLAQMLQQYNNRHSPQQSSSTTTPATTPATTESTDGDKTTENESQQTLQPAPSQPLQPETPAILSHELFQPTYDPITNTERPPIGALYQQHFDLQKASIMTNIPEPSYDLVEMAVDVLLLCDHLKVNKFHILGVSMGGFIASLVAALVPNRILSIISIMSSTGNPNHTPKLWLLFKRFLSVRPPAPPHPTLKHRPEAENAESITSTEQPQSTDSSSASTDQPAPVPIQEAENKSDKSEEEAATTESKDENTTIKPADHPEQSEKSKEKLEKKQKKKEIAEYKAKLKEYNTNLKNFNNFVNYLCRMNTVSGEPLVCPFTGKDKMSQRRHPYPHTANWVRRCPQPRGVERQAHALASSPVRDPLMWFVGKHIPVFIVHGELDEVQPYPNSVHSFNILKHALDSHLQQTITFLPPSVPPKVETAEVKEVEAEVKKDEVVSDDKKESTEAGEDKLEQETKLESTEVEKTETKPEEEKKETVEENKEVEKVEEPKRHVLLSQNSYTSGNKLSSVYRVSGYNPLLNYYVQHRLQTIRFGKHDLTDQFMEEFVPQLLLHLRQVHQQLEFKLETPPQLKEIPTIITPQTPPTPSNINPTDSFAPQTQISSAIINPRYPTHHAIPPNPIQHPAINQTDPLTTSTTTSVICPTIVQICDSVPEVCDVPIVWGDEENYFGLEDEFEEFDFYDPQAPPPEPVPAGHKLVLNRHGFHKLVEATENDDGAEKQSFVGRFKLTLRGIVQPSDIDNVEDDEDEAAATAATPRKPEDEQKDEKAVGLTDEELQESFELIDDDELAQIRLDLEEEQRLAEEQAAAKKEKKSNKNKENKDHNNESSNSLQEQPEQQPQQQPAKVSFFGKIKSSFGRKKQEEAPAVQNETANTAAASTIGSQTSGSPASASRSLAHSSHGERSVSRGSPSYHGEDVEEVQQPQYQL